MSHDITHSHIPKTYTIMTIRKEVVGFPNLGTDLPPSQVKLTICWLVLSYHWTR